MQSFRISLTFKTFLLLLYKEYSTPFSCKYTGKTLKAFAFRVHAHAHGDVNSAYKVDEHEWTPLAIGDPQWPQAFYPFDNTVEIKDGKGMPTLVLSMSDPLAPLRSTASTSSPAAVSCTWGDCD